MECMEEEVLCDIKLSKIIDAPGEVRITFFENGVEKTSLSMPKKMVMRGIQSEWSRKYEGQVSDYEVRGATRNPFLVSEIDFIKPT